MIRCILKPGKEKPVLGRHPWIFSGAIDQIDEGYSAGSLVRILSSRGDFLGIGSLNPESQIAVRVLSFQEEPIDGDFFKRRIQEAYDLRVSLGVLSAQTNACRIVHAEGDFLPGVVADLYGPCLVVQFLTAGAERWKREIAAALESVIRPAQIYESGESEFRVKEGLRKVSGVLHGPSDPPEEIEILENGLRFYVSPVTGQKTGFFLDQRDNRTLVRKTSGGRKVLNAFSYTGAFSVYAAAGGAVRVTSVDTSASALLGAERHMKANAPGTPHEAVKRDVFDFLRQDGQTYGLVILDPPAFCKHKSQLDAACRGYKDINLAALKRIQPGGFLFTASCSSYLSGDLFQKVVFSAAKDASKSVRLIARTGHAPDHPVSLGHPEGEYLKGLFCQVL
ncbi:MAG: class I SAM-dependent rRNA methyltransferase [Candidatus Omnitrophica bacterium]|nr:class I SAM-dependent rRNA methyltransferase [Candidatus Omnitrophota bacterium]